MITSPRNDRITRNVPGLGTLVLTLLVLTAAVGAHAASLEEVYVAKVTPLHVAMKEANQKAVAEAEAAWKAFVDERRAAIPVLQEDLNTFSTQLEVYSAYLGDCWDYYVYGQQELPATSAVLRERIRAQFFSDEEFATRYHQIWSDLAAKITVNRDQFLSQLDVVVRTAELPVNAQINCGNVALKTRSAEELTERLALDLLQNELVTTATQWVAAVGFHMLAAQTAKQGVHVAGPVLTTVSTFGGPAVKTSVWVGLVAAEVGVCVYIDGLECKALFGHCNTFLDQIDTAVRYPETPVKQPMSVFAMAADDFNNATWRTVGKKLRKY